MLLIFVPGAKSLNAEIRAEHDLSTIFPGGPISRETFQGPNGKPGLLIGPNTESSSARVAFDANKQQWSPRFGLTSLVGTWNDTPPTPATLARATQLPGPTIKLLDGNEWQIPLLRQYNGGTGPTFSNQLPCVLTQCQTTGVLRSGDVVPEYQEIWTSALEIGEYMLESAIGDGEVELKENQLQSFVADVLALNYTVDISILSHLRLLSLVQFRAILRKAIDWDTLETSLKKTLAGRVSADGNIAAGDAPQIAD